MIHSINVAFKNTLMQRRSFGTSYCAPYLADKKNRCKQWGHCLHLFIYII